MVVLCAAWAVFVKRVAVFVPLYAASINWNCPSVTPLDAVTDEPVDPLYVEKVSPVVEGRLILTLSFVAPLPRSNNRAPAATEFGLATSIAVIPDVKLEYPVFGICKNCEPLKFTAGHPFTAFDTRVG